MIPIGNFGSKLNSTKVVGSLFFETEEVDTGGDIINKPEAGCDEIYACAIRQADA